MKFPLREKFSLIKSVWGAAVGTIRRYPQVIIPFLVIAVCETLALTLLYLAPRPPLSAFLAPPIRVLYPYPGLTTGEPYLHYPANFLLLPILFSHVQIIIGISVGLVMTAVAIRMVFQIEEGGRPDWLAGLKLVILRFPALLVIWLIVFGLQMGVGRYLPRLAASASYNLARSVFYLSLLLVIIIETFFVYAVPAVTGEARRAWRAIIKSFTLTWSVFFPTFVVTLVPLIFRIALIFLTRRNPVMMERFSPEITLFILGGGILVALFSECFLRVSVTILFLLKRETT